MATRATGGLTRRLVAASVVLALVVGGGFAVMLLTIGDLRGDERRARHLQRVTVAANQLERLLLDLETGQRGFALTGEERFLEPWTAARASFPRRARTLLALVAADGVVKEQAQAIVRDERAYIHDYSVPLVRAARRGERSAASTAEALAGKRRVDDLRAQFDELLGRLQRAAAASAARAESSTRRAQAAAAVGLGGSLALVVLYVAYLRRTIVRPVRRAATMAGRLAGGDLAARLPETEVGEVGELERAFNVMGSSLERNRDELAALAEEQAALRRVATLVAQAASPADVFSAVAHEVARLFAVGITNVVRYEDDGTGTVVGGWSEDDSHLPVGTNLAVAGEGVAVHVRETGRPARTDRFVGPAGSLSDAFGRAGVRAGAGSPIVVEGELWGVAIAGWRQPGSLAPGVEQRIAAFTELVATAIANAESQAELTASRARIVATADETRRRIERDLHDGAQQRLVSLALQLRGAQAAVPPELGELDAELGEIATGLSDVMEELREIARGIHPAILAEGGLGPALRTLARRSTVPVRLDVRVSGRLPAPLEVGAYYVVSEALTNTAKHAQASSVAVAVDAADDKLRVSVRDDGLGGAQLRSGSGLVGLKDRVEALGGRMSVESAPGAGTTVQAELPLGDAGGAS